MRWRGHAAPGHWAEAGNDSHCVCDCMATIIKEVLDNKKKNTSQNQGSFSIIQFPIESILNISFF